MSTHKSRYLLTSFHRNAVDFGVPLFMEPRTAVLFAQCMSEKLPKKTGEIPAEVRRWSDFIGGKPL